MMNFGLMYNKEYYRHITFTSDGKAEMRGNAAIDKMFGATIAESDSSDLMLYKGKDNSFRLTTTYPGLLLGSGYEHGIGGKEMENEFQLGFYFDHASGLPVIPGSSIKGVLRYAVKINDNDGKYIASIVDELIDGRRKASNTDLITSLKTYKPQNTINKDWVNGFVNNVFEGAETSIYKRDIFLEAIPVKSNKTLFGDDYITPHPDPLKNPKPIKFLKIMPEVTFLFQFSLTDTFAPKAIKLELFRQILLDLGLGAKTNVGYGQFR